MNPSTLNQPEHNTADKTLDHDAVYARETAFHDDWAASETAEALDSAAHFTAETAPENRFIMACLGDISGKSILDVGCGLGENSVYLAGLGARVTASDLSPGMVDQAVEAGRLAGLQDRIDGRVLNAMDMDVADDSYDIVYASNILHHCPDPLQAVKEMQRIVRPGGQVCAWDPLRHNPVINVYRRMATEVRSDDEMPLSLSIIKQLRPMFSTLNWDTFWLSTLWIFLKFYAIERADPNKVRYWKKIINEHERLTPTHRRLSKLDRVLKKIPGMKRMAWNLAFVGTK